MHHLIDLAALGLCRHTLASRLRPILLRWVHFLAGILWIGLLYFF